MNCPLSMFAKPNWIVAVHGALNIRVLHTNIALSVDTAIMFKTRVGEVLEAATADFFLRSMPMVRLAFDRNIMYTCILILHDFSSYCIFQPFFLNRVTLYIQAITYTDLLDLNRFYPLDLSQSA